MVEAVPFILSIVFTLVGPFMIYHGFKKMRHGNLIRDTPTSKIRSMAMGIVEIAGKVSGIDTIKAPFSNEECVCYKYIVKRYTRHTRSTKNGTQTYYTWDVVQRGDRRANFLANDDTGSVEVDAKGADIDIPLNNLFYQRANFARAVKGMFSVLNMFDTGKSDLDVSSWNLKKWEKDKIFGFYTVGDRKYYEYLLRPGDDLYILGTAANTTKNKSGVVIKKGSNEATYIISNLSEDKVANKMRNGMLLAFIFGVIFTLVGLAIVFVQLGIL